VFRENRANYRRENFPPIRWAYHQLPTKTGHLQGVFQRFSRVRSTESSEVMERAMGIEPTSQAWEVLNFPIPFSSQGDARPLVSVNRWASKAHPVRPNSNCPRLSTVSAHMVNDAAQTGCVATPTIYLRRPRRPTSDRVAKTSPAGLQSFGFISDDLSEYMAGNLSS
jgi:hypothetical protein